MNPTKIGKRIKEQRTILDITQEELGKPLGLNKSTIQRYETGQVDRIKLPVLQEIAKILNVNPNWLACKTDEKTEYPSYLLFDHLSNSTINQEPEEDSIISDLRTAFKIQNLEKIRMQQEANTYTIHGSDGKGAVVITSDIPKDKYLLIGEGEASELTKGQYSALKGVLEAMSSEWEDK